MFGYDDDELNKILMAKALDPHVTMLVTLDKSQAGGKHEKQLRDLDKSTEDGLAAFNTHFVIGQSATHQISHTKGFVADSKVGAEGSTNWSVSGEGTFLVTGHPGGSGYKAQNNTQSIFTDPDTIALPSGADPGASSGATGWFGQRLGRRAATPAAPAAPRDNGDARRTELNAKNRPPAGNPRAVNRGVVPFRNHPREANVRPGLLVCFRSLVMDKERVAGGVKKATGSIKKAAGKATGNRRLEAEGRAEKAEGHVRSAVGKAKDAVRELVGGKR